MGKKERRSEERVESFEMSEMSSTLLERMTSQIPLLIEDEESTLEQPTTSNDDGDNNNDEEDDDVILNENNIPDLESPLPFSENASASGASQSHSFNVISAKKPFREIN